MSGLSVREYRREDIPELKALWLSCFDDTPGFADKFFAALPAIGSGAVALENGAVLGAAYIIDALTLVGGESAVPVGYIYGVGVLAKARGRGIGAALDRAAASLGKARGAKIITTLPAEDSLYGWYEEVLGVKARLFRRERVFCSAGCAELAVRAVRIPAGEYGQRRGQLLSGLAHIALSPAALEFEEALLAEYGGGLYAVCGGIAAACTEDGRTVIKELLLPEGECAEKAEQAAAALAAALGTAQAVLLSPAVSGAKYIAADTELPPDCIWNLSFD